jgi:hypothetical protein
MVRSIVSTRNTVSNKQTINWRSDFGWGVFFCCLKWLGLDNMTIKCHRKLAVRSWPNNWCRYSEIWERCYERIVLVILQHYRWLNRASWWIPVRQPMRVLVRLPGPADNAGTGRTSIWTHAATHCAISNTSLLLAREIHPDKKNFALEHCQPAPTVGKPLEWQMNDHLSWCNWPLNI